ERRRQEPQRRDEHPAPAHARARGPRGPRGGRDHGRARPGDPGAARGRQSLGLPRDREPGAVRAPGRTAQAPGRASQEACHVRLPGPRGGPEQARGDQGTHHRRQARQDRAPLPQRGRAAAAPRTARVPPLTYPHGRAPDRGRGVSRETSARTPGGGGDTSALRPGTGPSRSAWRCRPTPPERVAVTGAAGQIGYALLFRIAAGDMLGKDQPVELRLLEIPPAMRALEGVIMELEDCAFPLLHGVEASDDAGVAFDGADYALLVGSRPRGPGMERKDLLQANGAIFTTQGKALNERASREVKVLVVGNPANTNCLIAMRNAPDLSPTQFSAMTR